MSNYSNNPGMVRVSLFKAYGKWYACGSVDMSSHYKGLIHEALYDACVESHVSASTREGQDGWPVVTHPRDWLKGGCTIVCLEPYHEHSHPIMLTQVPRGCE